jgi:hypothetical protein
MTMYSKVADWVIMSVIPFEGVKLRRRISQSLVDSQVHVLVHVGLHL